MSNSITSKWYRKLILIILIAVVLMLIRKSFIEGYKEGKQMKLKEAIEK